jgi:hypothetical protein
MAHRDIRPLGTGDGTGFYWTKTSRHPGSSDLVLVSIDEFGQVTTLPIRARHDDAAMTRAEAVERHLAGAIAEADRDLERRRREEPEPQAKPQPVDPATTRFLGDGD